VAHLGLFFSNFCLLQGFSVDFVLFITLPVFSFRQRTFPFFSCTVNNLFSLCSAPLFSRFVKYDTRPLWGPFYPSHQPFSPQIVFEVAIVCHFFPPRPFPVWSGMLPFPFLLLTKKVSSFFFFLGCTLQRFSVIFDGPPCVRLTFFFLPTPCFSFLSGRRGSVSPLRLCPSLDFSFLVLDE